MADSDAGRVDEDTDLEEKLVNEAMGEEIRMWRAKRRLSQATLARAARMDPKTLGRLERGERAADTSQLYRLSRALGIKPSILINAAMDELEVE